MKLNDKIVLNLLQVWDPYSIYVFPDDEYKDYVNPILIYFQTTNITMDGFVKFLFELIPPIEKSEIESILRIEYERFAKLVLEIVGAMSNCE